MPAEPATSDSTRLRRAVVTGVDGSPPSQAAAHHAAAEAALRGAPLLLVHGYLHPLGYGVGHDPFALTPPVPPPAGAEMLRRLADELRAAHPGLAVHTRQVCGGPAAALLDAAGDAELLVVGSRGHGGFTGLLLGSVGAQVAAHAPCPVVIVRPGAGPQDPPEDTGSRAAPPDAGAVPGGPGAGPWPVVVGVDGSAAAAAAVEFAFAAAQLRRAPLVALHAWWADPMDTLRQRGRYDPVAAERTAADLLRDAVAPARARHPEVPVEHRLVHGMNAEEELIEASAGAGLTVVGSRGRGGFAGLLLGSVSQALVQHGHGVVAVVRAVPDTDG